MQSRTHDALAGLALAAAAAAALCGCASDEQGLGPLQSRPLAATPYDASRRPVSERAGIPLPSRRTATVIDRTRIDPPPVQPSRLAAALLDGPEGESRRVTVSLRRAPAEQFFRVFLAETLGRDYVLDPDLALGQGPDLVTLEIDAEMSDRDVMDLVEALCVLHGWVLEPRGDLLVVRRAQAMGKMSAAPILEAQAALTEARAGLRVYRFQHLDPREATTAITPLISDGGVSSVAGRMMLVVDRVESLNRIGEVVSLIDVPTFAGTEVWSYRLGVAQPSDVSTTLNTLAGNAGLGEGSNSLGFVGIDQADLLMVIASDPTLQSLVQQWIEVLDRPLGETPRERFIYRLQHYSPTVMSNLLRGTFGDKIETAIGERHDRARITVDSDEETLICYATPQDYAEMLDLMRRLDRPRQQVLLNVTIAEVGLTESFSYGIEAGLVGLEIDGNPIEFFTNASGVGPVTPFGTAFVTHEHAFAVIEALDSETDLRILSRPRIFVRDRETASFQVGGEEPILQSTSPSNAQVDGDSAFLNEVVYRDTGILLELQPRVNEQGLITILVQQEVTDTAPAADPTIGSPAFTVRGVETTVDVPHGGTVLLAGFIEETTEERISGIPLLRKIPLLGKLFESVSSTRARNEILIAITPTVVNDPVDALPLHNDMVRQAELLRTAFDHFESTDGLDLRRPAAPPDSAAPDRDDDEDAAPPPPREAAPPQDRFSRRQGRDRAIASASFPGGER